MCAFASIRRQTYTGSLRTSAMYWIQYTALRRLVISLPPPPSPTLLRICYDPELIKAISPGDIVQVDSRIKAQVEKELIRVRPLVDLAASTIQRIRDRCAYGWVQMNDLFIV